MTQLAEIRCLLAGLRRRRSLVRWGTALATVAAILVASWTFLFLLDVWLELSSVQRAAMWIVTGVGWVGAIRRYVRPFVGIHETEIDAALLVERQFGTDSDLVAALQFEQPQAARWGSPALAAEVIRQVARKSPQVDLLQGERNDQLRRRLGLGGGVLVLALAVAVTYPRHVPVFFQRWLFSNRSYPSATVLESVQVNGAHLLAPDGRRRAPRELKCAQGQPVTFLVTVRGELPSSGRIECRAVTTGQTRTLELRRVSPEEESSLLTTPTGAAAGRAAYSARLPRLVEPFHYTLQLGDAGTEPSTIQLIPLPVVGLEVIVVPPAYAATAVERTTEPRHIDVLEGSQIQLNVTCVNGKSLRNVMIRCQAAGQTTEASLIRHDAAGKTWSLARSNSPLDRVTAAIQYEILVEDVDGLTLEAPLRGLIQLKPDRPPLAATAVVHRLVLPTAQPVIEYRLDDDYAVASAILHALVERPEVTSAPASSSPSATDPTVSTTPNSAATSDSAATPDSTVAPVAPEEPLVSAEGTAAREHRIELPLASRPVRRAALPYRDRFPLDLSRFQLARGDKVKVTLEVIDDRGPAPGATFFSEPLLLEVSDEAGVLQAITEADERSEKRLSEIIQQQLGVGGSP